MVIMRIEFTDQISTWVNDQIAAGAFGSQSEVVQHTVRSFIQQSDPRYFAKLAATNETNDASLVDQIVDAVRAGDIAEPFGFEQIFNRFGDEYSESNLRTCLANFAVDEVMGAKGWHVAQGRTPRFIRVSRGQYKVVRNRPNKPT